MTNKQEWIKELTEKLADIEHQRWTSWYEYQRDATTPEAIARWNRQAETSYKDLSEEDKEKDREQVYKYLPLISDLLKDEEKRITERTIKRMKTEHDKYCHMDIDWVLLAKKKLTK